jgi:hypothetical protein
MAKAMVETELSCLNCKHSLDDHEARVSSQFGQPWVPIPDDEAEERWDLGIRCREGRCLCQDWDPAV